MKKILLLFMIAAGMLQANTSYSHWLDEQLALTLKMHDDNITQETILKIVKKQEFLYTQLSKDIMINKRDYLDSPIRYEKELFSLDKVIKYNKYIGNDYAAVRDEVLVKSYQLIRSQNKMIRGILRALDKSHIETFEKKMNDLFVKNQFEIQEIVNVDYKPLLQLVEKSDTLKEAQQNIKNFYALLEINADILIYISNNEKRMYRLNKYASYGLIEPVLAIDSSDITQSINTVLSSYGLDVVKILLILLVSLIIYIIRKILFSVVEKIFLNALYLKKYSEEILMYIRRPIEIMLILINLQLAVYIYHDFNSFEFSGKLFNMLYAFFFTFIVYKVLNAIAAIKIIDLDPSDKKIKHEVINVGIKVVNFLIWILGLVLILHFSGANLTAVLSGLGIGGFAVAIAARESLSNFFGTISILLSDTFSQGDWIVVNDKQGTVVEIGLRITTLRTFDNALIAIPNAILANDSVKNWSKRSIGRRIKMNVGVKYDSKSKDIQNAVSQIRDMLKDHPGIATERSEYQHAKHKHARLVSKEDDLGVKKTLLVYLDEFSDSSINILVYCFSKTTKWNEWLEIKEDVMYKIMDILEKNSLEFAFPSISLYNENESVVLEQ
jgi:MscS family membrane protein